MSERRLFRAARTLPRAMLGIVAAVTAVACHGSDDTSAPPIVQSEDSSGVRLLRLKGDLTTFASPRVALRREFELGERDGTELYRVIGATFLASGDLAIANAGVPEVVIARDGEVVTRFGSRGEGPGEFGVISSIHTLAGERIIVYDHAQGRLTEFDVAGELHGTRAMTEPSRVADLRPLTLTATGNVVAVYTDQRRFRPGEVVSDTTPLLRYGPGQSSPDTLSRWHVRTWSFGLSGMGATRTEVPYSPTLLSSGAGSGFVMANSHESAVTVCDADGERVRSIRWDAEPRRVSEDDVRRWNEARWSGLPAGLPEEVRQSFMDVEAHPFHPVLNGVHMGEGGDVWLAPAALLDGSRQTWILLGPDGAPRGGVRLTEGSIPLASRDGRVAVMTEDAFGVEIITVSRLSG